MLQFLVTGTLRSGTAYTAQVLNRAGIACGHGWAYPPDGVRRYPHVEILGDAAPLAAPFVADFPGLVLHQVRHPLAVIGSLVGFTAMGNRLAHGPVGEFLARHFTAGGDPMVDAMRYYVEWNSLCERHNGYYRYRVEDFSAGVILRIADLIGQPLDAATLAEALAAVPVDFNSRYGARRLRWSDLPEGASRDALARLAERYGYSVADPCPPRVGRPSSGESSPLCGGQSRLTSP
jgi:hypothetical protein